MKTYAITIKRELTQQHCFELEAESEDAAQELAEDEILNIPDDAWDDLTEEDPEITKVVEVMSDDDETEEAAEQEAA